MDPAAAGQTAASSHPEAAELAEIIKELGESLREVESAMPGASEPGAADPETGAAHETDLGSMAPSEVERRNAARLMKRIFRNRAAPRDREP